MASISEKFSGRLGLCGMTVLLVLLLAAQTRGEAYRDALGRRVDVPVPATRIVSLAPNLTEILFALGLGEEVAGVTAFCDWPPAAKEKPRVGGFVNPSIEAVVALNPDLVLATADGNRESDVTALDHLGVPVYVTDSRSVENIITTIRTLGLLGGKEKAADALAGEIVSRRDRVLAAVAGRPAVTVFVALDRVPLVSAGRGTFVDELVELAGGVNIVDSGVVKYPVMNSEQLVARDPQVIVAATMAVGSESAASRDWDWLPGAPGLRAVREGRVHEVGRGDFFRPGPRIMESLEELAAMFHPEVFP
jgi:iron complex transport system substrate-binding protein